MNKSIENTWKESFINDQLGIPKINELYNRKSLSIVEGIISEFERGVLMQIPVAVGVFLWTLWLDNDNALFWGIISASPCLIWFYIGREQAKGLRSIKHESNCYQYLLSIRAELSSLRKSNKRLVISSVPIILFPMLLYTYFKQEGKSLGEIIGVEGFNFPTLSIFLLLPIMTMIAYLIAALFFKNKEPQVGISINTLIQEIEELKESE
ncbi:MAG: hypothetical protein ACJA01_003443 [Saprospiraceae bacterium]|jgi:hypothetical protein